MPLSQAEMLFSAAVASGRLGTTAACGDGSGALGPVLDSSMVMSGAGHPKGCTSPNALMADADRLSIDENQISGERNEAERLNMPTKASEMTGSGLGWSVASDA